MTRRSMYQVLAGSMLFCVSVLPVSAAGLSSAEQEYLQRCIEGEALIDSNIEQIRQEALDYQRTHPQTRGVTHNGISYLDGDIFVTKSTSVGGILGHVGILVGDKVLDIHPKYNSKKPAAITVATWYARYKRTMVVRYTAGRTIPVNAAWYGQTFYINGAGRNNTYLLPADINSSTTSYCSSLVWKCFKNGAGFVFKIPATVPQYGEVMQTPSFITPYDFVNYRGDNGFTAAYTSPQWTK